MLRRVWVAVLLLGVCAFGAVPHPARAADPTFDFSTWHFPLPAGQWLISRGPCGGNGTYDHACGYFEDQCAYDLTPLSGSMDSVPVLAPQAGVVFFAGNRNDSGLSVMLQHADGRLSALFHLARIVVVNDQAVRQGQVVGYAGSTGSATASTGPHLHFDVQPNAVERSCLPLDSIDEVDQRTMTIVSHNLAWSQLTLIDPPDTLPAWLPLTSVTAGSPALILPGSLILPPGRSFSLPIAVKTEAVPTAGLSFGGRPLPPGDTLNGYTLFRLPLNAPSAVGNYSRLLTIRPLGVAPTTRQTLPIRFFVRLSLDTSTTEGMILIAPTFLSPPNYSLNSRPPRLCWSEPASAGPAPLTFRVLVVGPIPADSGWQSDTCWQTPTLPPGQYFWKVFVRDGQGYMNRPNQRPWAFKIQ